MCCSSAVRFFQALHTAERNQNLLHNSAYWKNAIVLSTLCAHLCKQTSDKLIVLVLLKKSFSFALEIVLSEKLSSLAWIRNALDQPFEHLPWCTTVAGICSKVDQVVVR
mmetsp:Transcript_4440/g.28301  ORF Transcript_4440/g.28301 Transcript_4440/m.28301 type:complete len:109 (-) Transcript_4440:2458-2784(-)